MTLLTDHQKKDLNNIRGLIHRLEDVLFPEFPWLLAEAEPPQHLKMLEAKGDVVRAVRKLEAVMGSYPRFLPDDLVDIERSNDGN